MALVDLFSPNSIFMSPDILFTLLIIPVNWLSLVPKLKRSRGIMKNLIVKCFVNNPGIFLS